MSFQFLHGVPSWDSVPRLVVGKTVKISAALTMGGSVDALLVATMERLNFFFFFENTTLY
jgi:hypothetical protein